MSSYFDHIERALETAVERRARGPWYSRMLRTGRMRGLVILLVGLTVAAPALGAVTNWFGFGAADRFPTHPTTSYSGRAVPGTGELLPLRVSDPQGGPPWGLRVAQTTRGDACIQIGRVEDGQLGSLGIDNAWKDDHLFHPFPATSQGQDCGTTDSEGHSFLNVFYTGMDASANPEVQAKGPQAGSCRTPGEYALPRQLLASLPKGRRSTALAHQRTMMRLPLCPRGGSRLVYAGMLGPDATAIRYRAPNGQIKTEKTDGRNGAYLLVFVRNQATCTLYIEHLLGGRPTCHEDIESEGEASPGSGGPITAIVYKNGSVCQVDPPAGVQADEHQLALEARKLPRNAPRSERLKLAYQFLKRHHLKLDFYAKYVVSEACPPVGWVAPKQKVTSVMVAAPISVRVAPPGRGGVPVTISFTARRAVTSSASWYEDSIQAPRNCQGSEAGQIGLGNVRAGQRLKQTNDEIPSCKGTYHGIVGYMPDSGPINQDVSGGGTPGRDGSVIVGRFTFTIR